MQPDKLPKKSEIKPSEYNPYENPYSDEIPDVQWKHIIDTAIKEGRMPPYVEIKDSDPYEDTNVASVTPPSNTLGQDGVYPSTRDPNSQYGDQYREGYEYLGNGAWRRKNNP